MNKKTKSIITALLAVVGVAVIAICVVWMTSKFTPKADGEITIEFVNGEEVVSKEIEFFAEDTLEKLITDNFENVLFTNGMIMNIEDYVTPEDWSTFIGIYVDGEVSSVGYKDIVFEDGTKISLIVTEFDSSMYE